MAARAPPPAGVPTTSADQPLGDHLRDAVPAHRDPVQRIGLLHRALLVGDHQELGILAEFLVDAEQA